jgi:Uma2 family endonuclease
MVRLPHPERHGKWDDAPTPILVVELLSPHTRRRDREDKRDYYLNAGVDEYWIVDPDRDEITTIHPKRRDVSATTTLEWKPRDAADALVIDVRSLFVG